MGSLGADLSADLQALRTFGVEPSRLEIYRSLLALGTIDDPSARTAAIEAAIVLADADPSSHTKIFARLVALPLVIERQREIVDELVALLAEHAAQA